jgi:uncharacterized protein (DUF885 family)
MVEKKYDIEAPEQSHHIESSSSAEKSDAEVARQWTDNIKRKPEPEAVTSTTKQKNPLAGLTTEELFQDVEKFAREKDLEHILEDLKKGALVAQDPKRFEELSDLTEEDKEFLRREKTHRWHQPFMMYFMTSMFSLFCDWPWLTSVVLCAGSAIVQGMDQTAVNGAQEYVPTSSPDIA